MDAFTRIAEMFRKTLTIISPVLNTKVTYRFKFHKRLKLDNPETLNEKIQWLKFNTYYNNPLVKQCADKYAVREYVEKCGLSNLLNELIYVYSSPEEIKWDQLPNDFALKLNVGCGFNHIVSNYEKENCCDLQQEIKKWIRASKTQWQSYSELQYKDVHPYILIEKYLGNPEESSIPEDYKVYCFNGVPQYIMVCLNRDTPENTKYLFFDKEWKLARINKDSINAPSDFTIKKPLCFDELIESSKILSDPFPFVRVDYYILNNQLIFGELTFTPSGGMDTDRLPETDRLMGSLLKLPK